ncbi:MAG: GNAT family N-acetyltransferase [Rhodospirillales bacterium]
MAMTIREASIVDFDAVLPLFQAFYREEGFDHAVSRVPANLREILQRDDTRVLVAEIDGDAVGAASLSSAFGLEVGLYAELEDLYVHPDHRGKGIAGALIEASCEWARSIGCHDIEIVMTRHGREQAGLVPFYVRHGFEDADRMIMERVL